MPLTEGGLMLVHNALVGTGLRGGSIKIGASGKVASGVDIVSRICQCADFTMSARAMMFAVGCIQALKCNTNKCPTGGVATQDKARPGRSTFRTRLSGWSTSSGPRWPAPPRSLRRWASADSASSSRRC